MRRGRAQARARRTAKLAMRAPVLIGSEVICNFGLSTARAMVMGVADKRCVCGSALCAIELSDGTGSGLICTTHLIRTDAVPDGVVGVA